MSLSRRRFLQSSTATTTLLALPAAAAIGAIGGNSFEKPGFQQLDDLDRLSPRSREVLRLARRESQKLGFSTVRSEHLLLGLIAEAEQSGAAWVDNLGASLEDFRCVTACVAGQPTESNKKSHRFSPNAVACFVAGHEAADLMGYDLIEPEHLLMAIAEVPDSDANLILKEMWFEETALQQEATASLRTWTLA